MMRYITTAADISQDTKYRYWLDRRWGPTPRAIVFVGLNPSTADAAQDDPTIRRCVGFAARWGFDRLVMVNLYAWRTPNPRDLRTVNDPIGPCNIDTLRSFCMDTELVIAAWGAHPLCCTAHALAGWIKRLPHAKCLGLTKTGAPRHPLYVPSGILPIRIGVPL
jgi:hypothetical protein